MMFIMCYVYDVYDDYVYYVYHYYVYYVYRYLKQRQRGGEDALAAGVGRPREPPTLIPKP